MDATSVSKDKPKPEEQPQPQEPTPTHRGGGTWLLWLFIALITYVLSVGPAAKVEHAFQLHQKARSIDNVLEAIYFPVMWSARHSRPVKRALEWYLFDVWKLD